MKNTVLSLLLLLILPFCALRAQKTDTTLLHLQEVPASYVYTVEKKIDKYTGRISNKTEKTLSKLSRWENKIKGLLEKTSPATAQKLFAPGQPTFSSLLAKYKQGQSIANG